MQLKGIIPSLNSSLIFQYFQPECDSINRFFLNKFNLYFKEREYV